MDKEELRIRIRKVFSGSACPDIYYSSAVDDIVLLCLLFSATENIRLIEENQKLEKQLLNK